MTIHYHSLYFIHGHTNWRKTKHINQKGNNSTALMHDDIPLSEQALIQIMTPNKRSSNYVNRINQRQTWFKHFRTSKPLPSCTTRQSIKLQQLDSKSVLLIDASRSMRQNNLLNYLSDFNFNNYDHIFFHRESLYSYPIEGLTNQHLTGGTSFLISIRMIVKVAEQYGIYVYVDHLTDGLVGHLEHVKLNHLVSNKLITYCPIKL